MKFRRAFAPIAVLLAVVVILVAGGAYYYLHKSSQNEVSQIASQPSENNEQTSNNQTPTSTLSPTPTSSAIGYIKNVYDANGKSYLDIDYIQWLSYSAGTCWVGTEKPSVPECGPDGYSIVNENSQVRTFEISNDVQIETQNYTSCSWDVTHTVNLLTFRGFWSGNASCPEIRTQPYTIELESGVVVKITEAYTP